MELLDIALKASCQISDHVDERMEAFFIKNNVDKARVDIMRRSQLNKVFVTYEHEGAIVGAIYGAYKSGRAWVYSLVVAANMRRQGYCAKNHAIKISYT